MIALYKFPGDTRIWGDKYRVKRFHEDEQLRALAAGWHESPQQAKAAYEDRGPTREELEDKAKELGLRYPHNISDEKLLEKINYELDKEAASD